MCHIIKYNWAIEPLPWRVEEQLKENEGEAAPQSEELQYEIYNDATGEKTIYEKMSAKKVTEHK